MESYTCKSPILFLVFNRPDVTKRVFESIRQARPSKLYVAADGARLDREGETARCQQVRDIATAVDWDCEVKTLFREENLGCGKAVSEGITWFFENVEEGIILEDDCLPQLSFFLFCDALLEFYRDSDEVFHIGGTNPFNIKGSSNTYHYTVYNRIWGWACWRRSWKHYDFDIKQWPQLKKEGFLEQALGVKGAAVFSPALDKCYSKKMDTWDHQWLLARLRLGLAIQPGVNQISNIGFGPDATHTVSNQSSVANMNTGKLEFPLLAPKEFKPNKDLDKRYADLIAPKGFFHRAIRGLLRFFCGRKPSK
jgi:hypothetical protein